jgi:hypothetical protein
MKKLSKAKVEYVVNAHKNQVVNIDLILTSITIFSNNANKHQIIKLHNKLAINVP